MQASIDAAIQKADAEIAARTAEGEARIAEIRDGATAALRVVAVEAATSVVEKMGVEVDSSAITAAVEAKVKG